MAAIAVDDRSTREGSAWVGWAPLALAPLAVVMLHRGMPAWAFMWVLAIAIYASLKWASWWRSPMRERASWGRSAGYLLAWPGMDAESFLDPRRRAAAPRLNEWGWALAKTALGVVLLWGAARAVPDRWPLVQGWVGLVGMVLIAHFGSFHVASLVWRRFGVDAVPIMASPVLSQSLSEFWGRRWNLGFRQLGHELIFAPLHERLGVGMAGFLVFVASGLIHDLVISVPAGGGYGLPTAYFVLQGAGVALERSPVGRRMGLRGGMRGWLYMALFTAGPAFWLFHPPFLRNVVLPFMQRLGAI
jgi:Membrane bound O-acyl transferase family